MKGISTKIPKVIPVGAVIKCDDNSGAKELLVLGVVGRRGRHGRYPSAGIGDVVIATVKKGNEKMIKKIVKALIIRQKKEIRRADGVRVRFSDNAAVLVDDLGLPIATEIKGVIAREIAELYPKVAAIATRVV